MRWRPIYIAALTSAALAGLAPAPLPAAPSDTQATAEMLFEEGKQLLAAGQLEAACAKLETSHKIDPAPGTVVNLAICYQRLGRTASAWARFREAAAIASRKGQHKRLEFALAQADLLAPSLARLTVTAPADIPDLVVTRDGVTIDPSLFGSATPVDPGVHTVEAHAPGKQPFVGKIDVPAAGRAEIEVPALEDAPVPVASGGGRVRTGGPLVGSEGRTSSGRRGRSRRILGLLVGAGGVAVAGVGLVVGLSARSSWHDALDNHCDADRRCDPTGLELGDSARSKAIVSTVLVGVGLAAAAAGTILYLTAPSERRRPAVAPVVTSDGAGLTLLGVF